MDKSLITELSGIHDDFVNCDIPKEIEELIVDIPDFCGSVSVKDASETWTYFAKLKEKVFKLEAEICELMGENAELRDTIRNELGDGYC